MIGAFLKSTAKSTTIVLVVFLIIAGIGGGLSGETAATIGKTLGFLALLWPIIFVFMIPVTLLTKARVKAAKFGASLGRQAVNSPKKDASAAVRQAVDDAFAVQGSSQLPPRGRAGNKPTGKRQ